MSLEEKMKEKFPDELDPPEDVEDLDLENLLKIQSFSQADKTYLEHFPALVFLSLKNLGLEKLDNLPKLPCLQLVMALSTA